MRIAVTGGIGSGKSYVCRLLEKHGIAVYDCDAAAKRLMRESGKLQRAISDVVGEDVFPDGKLDKARLSRFIVSSKADAQRLDDVIHPAVAEDFMQSDYEWLESAILFESGFDKRVPFDFVVCVTAPEEIRIDRVMKRDNLTREKALGWLDCQMSQDEKLKLSDFEIMNDGQSDLNSQIAELLCKLNKYKLNLQKK